MDDWKFETNIGHSYSVSFEKEISGVEHKIQIAMSPNSKAVLFVERFDRPHFLKVKAEYQKEEKERERQRKKNPYAITFAREPSEFEFTSRASFPLDADLLSRINKAFEAMSAHVSEAGQLDERVGRFAQLKF